MKKTFRVIICSVLLALIPVSIFSQDLSTHRKQFIDCAKELLGTPYQFGSRVPSPGIDCSGLVAFCARKALQVNFTGSSQGMYNNSTKIKDEEREPGDLLFFSNTDDSARISHVAIYIGNNKFIHSVSDGKKTGVVINSLKDKSFWSKHYIASGRFLPSTKNDANFIKSDPKMFEIDTWWKDIDENKWFK